ncbi:MAG TPA: hypothetical protein VLD16_10650 [Gaiellaceae bacterium]|nr:hypothetical protein [Gaiellaceae bacterium]
MQKRNLAGLLLLLAALAAASATTSSSARVARPALTVVQRAPLVVRGTHFRPREAVRLTAAYTGHEATASVRTTRRGVLVARFGRFAAADCLRTYVHATGRAGERAALVIEPRRGSTGLPCGV